MGYESVQVAEPTAKNLAGAGRELIQSQQLRAVRERYGLSRSAQAHMIGVSPTALRNWENGNGLSRVSAERVADWFYSWRKFTDLTDERLLLRAQAGELVHVTVASQQLAMSYSTITEKCQSGVLRCHDLGPLGMYVRRDELANVHARRQS